jgi:eukaryotic-like serine/threonine-protein kinase
VVSLNPAGVHANLVSALPALFMDKLDLAWRRLQKARQVVPDEPGLTAQEALILAKEGKSRRAEELADEAVACLKSLTHTHHTWHDAGGANALCGKPDKAVVQLRRCAREGLPIYRLVPEPRTSRKFAEPPRVSTACNRIAARMGSIPG